MKAIHTQSCPVCSGKELKEKFVCRDFLVTNENFTIYSCVDCGFAFTQDFPSEEEIGRYYDTPEYISHSDTNKGLINSLYHVARKISLRSKSKLALKYAPDKTGTLLDIGCGTGYFLHAMCEKKWVVTGIEKSKPTREYAHQKFGLNIQNDAYLYEMPDKTKDMITLWHVLEHMEQLNSVMGHLHRVLRDNGTLIIAMPNKMSSDAAYYKNYWAAYDVPRHLWHFSPDDFVVFAEKHNFTIEKTKRMSFDPFYISMLSEKNKGTFAAGLIGLIKGFFFFLRELCDTNKCSSIIYVLRKK